jgi:hypothetical protein
MKLKVDFNHQVVQVPLLLYGVTDDELENLYRHMAIHKLGVLAYFLSFLETFAIATNVHNMLVLMLDPRFKGLKYVIDFFGHEKG